MIKYVLPLLTLLAMATAACAETGQPLPVPVQALRERGIQVVGEFKVPGDLSGYAAIMGRRPLAIYVTADGQHAIVGSMIDSDGQMVNQEVLQKMVAEPMSRRTWTQLQHSTWVPDGAAGAPRTVYVFSDPNCPYCHMFWQQARPWIESGKVQLRHVMVGIISETSPNKAAAILTADDPEQALARNKQQFADGGIAPMEHVPAEIRSRLISNLQLMRQLGLRGTPGIIYRDDKGRVQFHRGVPSAEAMTQILGPE